VIIWIIISTDGGHDETRGKAFTRPSEARLQLREKVTELFRYGAYGRKLTVNVDPEPGPNGWHEFEVEATSGDSVILAATHVVGSSYDWPLEPGQVRYAERMLNEVVEEVTKSSTTRTLADETPGSWDDED